MVVGGSQQETLDLYLDSSCVRILVSTMGFHHSQLISPKYDQTHMLQSNSNVFFQNTMDFRMEFLRHSFKISMYEKCPV
ncbi:unnamed protein product [Schistosoma margrebowiei]|uniref:Uncharacterized protein n=1 Tax=Schistosoma margrebowiei TaxID=48269 RepID=A0A183M8W3_9TREM|nr:unnamed protein product [Schistosoma margrebowiei]